MIEQQIAEKNLILKVSTGSHLYGTNMDKSDMDYQGIFVPPKQYVYGLHRCEQVILNTKHKDEMIDYTCFNLIKYIQLAIANNPNILSLLYTPQKNIHFINHQGQLLIDNRELFLSKKSYHSFRGYAHAQKKKLIIKAPLEGKRRELFDKYGYDTKFAMHLIRLLYEALDIMVGKEIIYPCPHNKYLLRIRNGEISLDEVFAESQRLEALVDEAYVKSDLQYAAQEGEIEDLLINMLEQFWSEN